MASNLRHNDLDALVMKKIGDNVLAIIRIKPDCADLEMGRWCWNRLLWRSVKVSA
jgi:hypothetical protein